MEQLNDIDDCNACTGIIFCGNSNVNLTHIGHYNTGTIHGGGTELIGRKVQAYGEEHNRRLIVFDGNAHVHCAIILTEKGEEGFRHKKTKCIA